ncbi:hypothetical protein K2224_00260 [Streptomyces sp. BHT-5-2]|uniref:hypothetical protein n=1 Tax=Streptomyces sp. BHT-5-2 TaxID=2866715 RepID=UPI001C8D0C5D|nr:hypothetical protein [Streptomyces sp. BHT-5-2]QZL01852.1 hypothetical protein K2224_00260 [Streptomyces sp. BHT-5-2]
MPRRSREELTEARNEFIANRENVIARYNEGESVASLARSYDYVGDGKADARRIGFSGQEAALRKALIHEVGGDERRQDRRETTQGDARDRKA